MGRKKEVTIDDYNEWMELRKENNLCYCSERSDVCDCIDPDFDLFKKEYEDGNVVLGDKRNGWVTVKSESKK